MMERGSSERRRGPVTIAELVGKALDPVTANRGFAIRQVITGWAEIVGPRYADCSLPEKILWPRGAGESGGAGTLIVRIDGPRALLFQHEIDQAVERVNRMLGQGTIDRIRIVQGPVRSREMPDTPVPRPLRAEEEERLASVLNAVENDTLRHALERLGRAVISGRDKKS